MSPVVSSSSPRDQSASRCTSHKRPPPCISSVPRRRGARPLAGYLGMDGRPRELLTLPGYAGSVLVLDRDATTLCDRRLVAHLAPDEPPENAMLVCRHYLHDAKGRWCRRVRPEDLEVTPLARPEHHEQGDLSVRTARLHDRSGNVYRLRPLHIRHATAQLRWCRRGAERDDTTVWEEVRLRDVIAALECYEPIRTLTHSALMFHQDDPEVLLTPLSRELERLCASPIVLNRGLREAVLDAIERRGMSMSEIALRCGIVKRDRRGNLSGETSWLARRIGLMPEGGASAITPWVHSDVLATIARKGLGISPREVELQ
jgi:hypothetical protein